MSAETLRRAASLMRERAAGVEDGCGDTWHFDVTDTGAGVVLNGDKSGDVIDPVDRETAEHIASWHPVVALAVANWLDNTAHNWEPGDEDDFGYEALAVARTYLGESA